MLLLQRLGLLGEQLILSKLGDEALLLLPDLSQVDVHLIVSHLRCAWLGFLARNSESGSALLAKCLLLHLCLGSFFELRKTHLRTFRVFFEDTLIGLTPFIKDVLKAIVSFSLSPFDQVADLETLLSKLDYTLVVLGQNLTLPHLQLLQVAFLLRRQRLLLTSLGVNGLGQDSLLLLQVLELLGELFVLGHILLRFLDADAVVLGYGVQLSEAITKFL